MGRGRGKGKKQFGGDDTGSGDDEKVPVRRRGRPQKPMKDEEDEVEKIEEDDEEDGEETKIENGRKRKRATQIKESATDQGDKANSKKNGSRRKNKPRRAAEVGVECKCK